MTRETPKPEVKTEDIEMLPLPLPPARAKLVFKKVHDMFTSAIEAGVASDDRQADNVETLYHNVPDAFDITTLDGRELSMSVERPEHSYTVTREYTLRCLTEADGVTRVLEVVYDPDAEEHFTIWFGSTDELAGSTKSLPVEKADIHLTKAESILLAEIGVGEDETADDERHLAAANAVLNAALYGQPPQEAIPEESEPHDAAVIDLAEARKRRRP